MPVVEPMAETSSARLPARPIVLIAALAGVMVAAAMALWAHHGTAIFFEMIRTGFMGCF